MKESEIQEYVNEVKQNKDSIKNMPQEFILEALKRRKEFNFKLAQINDLEKALDIASIKIIIKGNDYFGYEKSDLLRFVVEKKDIDFINEMLPIMFNGDKKAGAQQLTKAIVGCLHYEKDKGDILRLFIENRDEYGFSSNEMKDLIAETEDEEYIISCMEQSEKYGIDEQAITALVAHVDYPEYVKGKYEKEILESYDGSSKINLPKEMTIGVEIESEGPVSAKLANDYYVEDLIEGLDDWKMDEDGSLEEEIDYYTNEVNGIEFISPILRSDGDSEQPIYQVCTFLNYCRQRANENTGGHIHIGADYLTNINAYKNLIEIWANSEKILYTIANKEGEAPREVEEYAAPFSKKIEDAIENGLEEENLEQFINKVKEIQGERYSSINFQNLGDEKKNTIEFRLCNGTIDPKTWIENINLFGGIVVASQELSVIQEKKNNGQTITEEEQKKLIAFEKITTLDNREANEEDKLKALLELAINKDEQGIYFNRYSTNKELIKGRKIVEDVGIIKISRKQIGKLAFTGQEQITGVDYQQAEQIIENDLLKDAKENDAHIISE